MYLLSVLETPRNNNSIHSEISLTFVRREREREILKEKKKEINTSRNTNTQVVYAYCTSFKSLTYIKKRRTVNTNAEIDDETQKQFFTCRGSKVVHGVR